MREGQACENDTNFHNCCGKLLTGILILNSWIKLVWFDNSGVRKGSGETSFKIP